MIVSHDVYIAFVTLMVLGITIGWGTHDVILLKRTLSRGREAHDQIFGAVIGIIACAVGLLGAFKYYFGF